MVGILFGLILFYIASVEIDHALQKRAQAEAEKKVQDIPAVDEGPHVPLWELSSYYQGKWFFEAYSS